MRRLGIAVLMTTLLVAGGVLAEEQKAKDNVYEELNLFDEAFERVRQDAVDSVTDPKLVGAAIAGMLSGLDAHSAYLDPAAYKALSAPANDNQAEIGLVVTIDNGQLKVISPRDGSPAAKAGVEPGDLIYAIDKEPTYDHTLDEVRRLLRGPAGSAVKLTLRRGNSGPIKLEITRAAYQPPTVAGRVEADNIGYLRIAGFDKGTQAALAASVEALRQQLGGKLIGFILDLRNNPGGDFDAAVQVADAFIDKGDIAVVKGRKPDSVRRIAAMPGDLAKGLPLVALVNGGTAGEAELVAGALQDNHRAVLLGTKTFGESAIESVIPLSSGGAIRLTTARFVTPTGREIQGKGLDPDLTVTPLKLEKLAQDEMRHEADLPGALKNPDQPAAGTPSEGTPPAADAAPTPKAAPSVASGDIGSAKDEQLIQAVDVLRGLALLNRRPAG